jgi:hypothetical protein
MTTWKIGSGCVLKSGGIVEGDDAIAETIRFELEFSKDNPPPLTRVLPAPETVPVEVDSDWHLDRYAHELAQAWVEEIETDYVQGPVPADVQRRLDAIAAAGGNTPGKKVF